MTGTTSCDPTRRTPWGTIVFGEEAGGGATGGRLYELIDPLHTTGVTLDRTTGLFSGGVGANNLVTRTALGTRRVRGPRRSWTTARRTSTVTTPDSARRTVAPATRTSSSSPTTRSTATTRSPTSPQSPYASGEVYGLRVGLGTNYGQGREFGFGQWIPLPHADDPDLEGEGLAAGLTGYYRPEDADLDPIALRAGHSCGSAAPTPVTRPTTSTVRSICITDGTVARGRGQHGDARAAAVRVRRHEPGHQHARQHRVPAAHGATSVLHEDAETTFESPHNNDLWDCLPDGADQDLLSDGCVRIATLNDLTAEWTGGIFDGTGKHFFVSVQHNISGQATILEITGWK